MYLGLSLGSISIVSVHMLIIAGTIAMLGKSYPANRCFVQDAFVEMIGPAGIISIGALIST